MAALQSMHNSGHRKATEETDDQKILGKEVSERKCRQQEDAGGYTMQSLFPQHFAYLLAIYYLKYLPILTDVS